MRPGWPPLLLSYKSNMPRPVAIPFPSPDMIDTQSFIEVIKADDLRGVQHHAESGAFGERDLDQALFFSAFLGRQHLVRYFLRLGWPFLNKDRALQAAASAGRTRTLIHLQQNGGDPRTHEDFPFHLAITKNHPVTSAYLVLAGADAHGGAERSIRAAYSKGFRNLALDCVGIQPYARAPDQALEWAVRHNKEEFALAAVLAGASANLNDGELALVAARNGNAPLLRLLSHHGADILARGEQVARDTAIRSGSPEVLRAMADLVKMARAKPTILPPSDRMTGIKTVEGTVVFMKGVRLRSRRVTH